MNQKPEPTEMEHSIPQFYLRHFSPDGKGIFQLDTNSFTLQKGPASIKKICCEKDLYEFKNEQGAIIAQNLIEKKLKLFEDEAGIVFKSVAAKARCQSNLNILSFLSKKEKNCLIYFMTLLRLRDPVILDVAQKELKEAMDSSFSDYELRNEVLRMCLPIYKPYNKDDYKTVLYVLKWFTCLSFEIYYSSNDSFITSDNPVIISGNAIQSDINISFILFPMTPNVSILMKPIDRTDKEMKNRLVKASKDKIDIFNSCVVGTCHRWIYSSKPFSENDVSFFKNKKEIFKSSLAKISTN